jgi:hypothetical protein
MRREDPREPGKSWEGGARIPVRCWTHVSLIHLLARSAHPCATVGGLGTHGKTLVTFTTMTWRVKSFADVQPQPKARRARPGVRESRFSRAHDELFTRFSFLPYIYAPFGAISFVHWENSFYIGYTFNGGYTLSLITRRREFPW